MARDTESMKQNPFTIVYDAIVDVLRRDGFKLVDWNSSRSPEPGVREETDFPELQLRPTAMTVQIGSTSCGTIIERTFTLFTITGDDRLGYLLFPVEWKLMHSFYKLKFESLEGLEFNGSKFVTDTNIISCTSDLDLAAERAIEGWDALWDITVHMGFGNADLAKEL